MINNPSQANCLVQGENSEFETVGTKSLLSLVNSSPRLNYQSKKGGETPFHDSVPCFPRKLKINVDTNPHLK
uniref:Uncharacterized protein n=1 Tax=Rhizophora mucronata TaxID=61149 RepID=A0A2P2NSW2_RHIMU